MGMPDKAALLRPLAVFNEAMGRVGALVNGSNYSDFRITFDVMHWNNGREYVWGPIARATQPGLGSTDGYLLLGMAAVFALITALGVFGLASYTAEQKTKEVGIRKVLGANAFDIVGLLSKNFLVLVMIASLIAFPIAWWAMNTWLQDYDYRVTIQWWVFALAAILSIAIAVITVSFQAIKAAIANPVKSLRTE
jgi:ABC-type antimicrobial peptide transport system permease subunit